MDNSKPISRAVDLASATACGLTASMAIAFGMYFRAPLVIAIGGIAGASSAYMAWRGVKSKDNS